MDALLAKGYSKGTVHNNFQRANAESKEGSAKSLLSTDRLDGSNDDDLSSTKRHLSGTKHA